MAKDPNYIKLINTQRWRNLRLKKLQAIPLCECCKQNGKYTLATLVHHITAVESVNTISQMEILMFDYDNLMSLCDDCHIEVHAEMFSHTKENVKKANERRTQRFIDKFF